MNKHGVLKSLLALLLLCMVLSAAALPASALAKREEQNMDELPGKEAWQKYLDSSPVDAESFAKDPLNSLRGLFPLNGADKLREIAGSYSDALIFLLLAALLSFVSAGTHNAELLDMAAAGGCGVLLWSDIMELSEAVCARIDGWQNFLMGFLPVYSGVLAAGGETMAGASVNGLMLTALCFVSELLGMWVKPLLQCYLALSIACCVSAQSGLAEACRAAGTLLDRGLKWSGRLFVLLMGTQRIFTLQLDGAAVRMGRLLTGTVPIIGQTLSDAAQTVLSGMQMLKSGLGLAAVAVLAVEFAPLYLGLIIHSAMLFCCGLMCDFANIKRCRVLFACLAQAVQCMAAATALYFGIAAFGTGLMMAVGGA